MSDDRYSAAAHRFLNWREKVLRDETPPLVLEPAEKPSVLDSDRIFHDSIGRERFKSDASRKSYHKYHEARSEKWAFDNRMLRDKGFYK